jgi:uncharacterized protein
MKKLILLLAMCAAAIPPCCAAQQSTNTDLPDKADVVKFLDLIHAKQQMEQALEAMAKQTRLGAEQGFKQRVPDATPEQLAKVDQVFNELFTSLPLDQMVDAIVPIYQKHLTKTDLNAIMAFYASPAGQKILTEMPAIMSESMQAGGDIGRRTFEKRSKEFEEKVDDLVRQANTVKN